MEKQDRIKKIRIQRKTERETQWGGMAERPGQEIKKNTARSRDAKCEGDREA